MTDLLDEVCAWVRGGSYAPEEARLTDAVMAEDARLLAEAFTGEAGRKRLMVFARLTVLRPPVDHRLPEGVRQAYAENRQGQDSIFAALVRYLDIHEANLRTQTDDRSDRPDTDAAGWRAAAGTGEPADERFSDTGWDAAGLVAGR
uniref:Uncharacterized protein n=1 Tax=viral metagenome TaxID=1070528 RepID=A0A6M3XBR7_9ZZZZ